MPTAPAVDHPDLDRSVWHNLGEDVMFGVAAVATHGVRGVWRGYLQGHPDRLEQLRQRRPDGPLALSYLPRRESPPLTEIRRGK